MARSKKDTYKSKARQKLINVIGELWGTQKEMAEELGITRLVLNHYILGKTRPNLETAAAIERLTKKKGKKYIIYASEWVNAPEE